MADLQISNIINISVAQTPTGIGAYNTSNVALFTAETPNGSFSGTFKIYLEPTEVITDWGSSSATAKMALSLFSQAPNIRAGGGYLVVIPYLASEKLVDAIPRTMGLVQYFGIMSARIEPQADMLAGAGVVQTLNKMAFFVQKAATSIDPAGSLDLLRSGNFKKSRGLYYGSAADIDALQMQAAYVGRALSTDFSGSNTTQTMNMKDLATIQPDPSMTQTLYTKAEVAGADIYASFQGVAKVVSNGTNGYFDQVYNLGWFVGALQVACFNYLAQSSTKVPQTEEAMTGFKGAQRQVCETAKKNQYVAAGKWNSPNTFGVQDNFFANILNIGYYIYSAPITEQLQVDREARKAPLCQIAIKEAGAIHKGSVIININA